MDPYDKKHLEEVQKLLASIQSTYYRTGKKVAGIGSTVTQSGASFSFADDKKYKQVFRTLFRDMHRSIYSGIVNGVSAEWSRGEDKAIDTVAKQLKGKLSKQAIEKLKADKFGATKPAYAQFEDRMKNKLNLSERVWQYTDDYKRDLELLININSGKSAADIAVELQKFLNNPDDLFRRVRDEAGKLKLSRSAASYHSDAGVYRSSYKNAHRLARTEVNMAYRRAENARYQSLPFVVGFEVRLSNAHPVFDICDDLKGKYPKDFIFSGWHPQCLCYTTAILNTEAEYDAFENALLNGEPLPTDSVNKVIEVPEGFSKWVERNKERAGNWKSQPYFIRDNFKGGTLDGGLKFIKTPEIVLPITPEMKG